MPQLDGVRAIAVGGVLIHHLLVALPNFETTVPWGLVGVRLFFVLSGFLITGLLIHALDTGGDALDRPRVMKQFYIRRALRIFPIYYLVLAAAWAVGSAEIQEQLPWLATYTYNLWVSHLGWFTASFAHFWSLCVEEQFYLVWPWLVVFAPRRHVFVYAIVMVIAGPAYRYVALVYEFNDVALYALTPSSLDALGLGALLALVTRGYPVSERFERRLRLLALPLCVLGLVAIRWSHTADAVLYETFVAVGCLWLVAAASRGFRGVAGRVLEARPVMYLGKISYGVYVYHLLIRDTFKLDFLPIGVVPKEILDFVIYTAATIALASLSWFALERPILRLKDRWAYTPHRAAQPSLARTER
jgi:peptidoglycan/LPS O-acetylase OafA/YrhL